MVIRQRDVFWVQFPAPRGSEPAGRRPAVVLQEDRLNRSAINTTVVAAITSNLKYAAVPGNVRLRRGDGGLPQPSVVNVTQISTIDKSYLVEHAGTLSHTRFAQVADGIKLTLGLDRL